MKPVAGYREDEWVKGRIASAEALGGQDDLSEIEIP